MPYEEEAPREAEVHCGHRARMRERAASIGLRGFQPHEVLELLLSETIPRVNVNPLAHQLILQFGSFSGVLDASVEELMKAGLSDRAAVHIAYQREVFAFYQHDRWGEKPVLSTVAQAGNYAASLFGRQREERMFIICLDSHMRVLAAPLVAQGVVNSVVVHPRTVVEQAMRHQAQHVILMHNHPGGDPTPSMQDRKITEQLSVILRVVGVRLRDHIIVAGPHFYSLARDARFTACSDGECNRLMQVCAEDYAPIYYDRFPELFAPSMEPEDLNKWIEAAMRDCAGLDFDEEELDYGTLYGSAYDGYDADPFLPDSQ